MTTVHPVKTGTIQIRPAHLASNINLSLWRLCLAILLDREWTEPLPIYTLPRPVLIVDFLLAAETADQRWVERRHEAFHSGTLF